MMRKYKSIAYTTSEPLKNRGNFLDYLLENAETVIVFSCTQGFSNERSYVERYNYGVKKFKKEFPFIKVKSKTIIELTNSLYLGYTLLVFVPRNSALIVDNPFFILSTRLISYLKNFKVVFWIGDYFSNYRGIMKLYNGLVNYYNKTLNYVLYVSPPIHNIYSKSLKKSEQIDKYRALVSFGFDQKPIRKTKPRKIKLGFIGVIRKMQGLDLVFDFLSSTKDNDVSIDVIGQGHELDYYKKLAKNLKIAKKVKFYGHVERMDPIVSNWDIGIALYENKKDNYSIYCEPTKIKNYLSFGIPVITTNATYMQKEIIKFRAGEVVEENVDSLSTGIQKIKSNYLTYLRGVHKIGEKYEYKKWYDKKFKFLERQFSS